MNPLFNQNQQQNQQQTNQTNNWLNVSISYTAPAIGDVVVNLQQDGTNVAGGSASDTVATATTEINNINITAIVRVFGGNAPDTLTLKNTGIAISTSNVSMTVVKL